MEQSFHWEADSSSTGQEIPQFLRNPKVYLHVQKNPPLDSALCQMNPIHTLPSYVFHTTLILSSRLRLDLRNVISRSHSPCSDIHSKWWVARRAGHVVRMGKREIHKNGNPENTVNKTKRKRWLCRETRRWSYNININFTAFCARVWAGLIWLGIGSGVGLLWPRFWTLWFHKRRAISWREERLFAAHTRS